MSTGVRQALGLIILTLLSSLLFAKTFHDVVVLTNGDRIQGEIKQLDKEVLTVETDYSDQDFKIKWEKVARIESPRTFLVETFAGIRTGGSITPDKTSTPEFDIRVRALSVSARAASKSPIRRWFHARQ